MPPVMTLIINEMHKMMIVLLYLVVGLVFSIAFVSRGVSKLDPSAKDAGLGARLLWVPAAALLWPLLAQRWRSAS